MSDAYAVGVRWSAGRKRLLLDSIAAGHVTRGEVMADHGLSEEELASWERRYAQHGAAGLKVTKLQLVGRSPDDAGEDAARLPDDAHPTGGAERKRA